jgi:hypothetical protein
MNMETNKDAQHEDSSSSGENQRTPPQGAGKKTGQQKKNKLEDTEIENPAAQSEIGAEIYDIGMGGPGASSSGIRHPAKDEDEDEE